MLSVFVRYITKEVWGNVTTSIFYYSKKPYKAGRIIWVVGVNISFNISL